MATTLLNFVTEAAFNNACGSKGFTKGHEMLTSETPISVIGEYYKLTGQIIDGVQEIVKIPGYFAIVQTVPKGWENYVVPVQPNPPHRIFG